MRPARIVDALLARYETYLLCQRKLARSSVRIYLSAVRPFLSDRLTEAGLALEKVTAREVTTFVPGCARAAGRAGPRRP